MDNDSGKWDKVWDTLREMSSEYSFDLVLPSSISKDKEPQNSVDFVMGILSLSDSPSQPVSLRAVKARQSTPEPHLVEISS